MFIFDGRCPHCHSDKGFSVFGISDYIIGDRDYVRYPLTNEEKEGKEIRENVIASVIPPPKEEEQQFGFSLAGECRACHKPVVAVCAALETHYDEYHQCLQDSRHTPQRPPTVHAIYPQPVPPYAHPALPEKVRDAFVDLQNMLLEKMQPHFIITGCRVVLEAAVRELGGGKEGDTLYARINDLLQKGIITTSLADWATIIRKIGNTAAHEMQGTTEEARELVGFTKLFLQFTFELPYIIAQTRCGTS